MKKHKCYPWRTFATPFMMTPLFFASVLGARHLVMLGDESFETGEGAVITRVRRKGGMGGGGGGVVAT
jgi:hypothetical protein